MTSLVATSTLTQPRVPVNSFDQSPQSRTGRSKGILPMVRVAGVLALALSGGARADNVRHVLPSQDDRENQQNSFQPYGFRSICDLNERSPELENMVYEDCIAHDMASINEIRNSKPLDKLTRCYRIAGYTGAALSVLSVAANCGRDAEEASMPLMMAYASAVFSIFITSICFVFKVSMVKRLHETQKVAEACCRQFPKADTVKPTLAATP